MHISTILRVATLAALVLAVVCWLAPAATTRSPARAEQTVTILVGDNWFCDESYQYPSHPCETVINVGDTVRWDFTPAGEDVKSIFLGDILLRPGDGSDTVEFTFEQPGVYEYYSEIHPLVLRGRIVVLGQATLPGDADCDGTVNSIDAAYVLQFAAGVVVSPACEENADASRDGTIDAVDAALILQLDAGLIDTLSPS